MPSGCRAACVRPSVDHTIPAGSATCHAVMKYADRVQPTLRSAQQQLCSSCDAPSPVVLFHCPMVLAVSLSSEYRPPDAGVKVRHIRSPSEPPWLLMEAGRPAWRPWPYALMHHSRPHAGLRSSSVGDSIGGGMYVHTFTRSHVTSRKIHGFMDRRQ